MSGEIFRPTELDNPQDNCTVIGVYSRQSKNVARDAVIGLIELNHRGQEGSGIVVTNGYTFQIVKDSGLAEHVFFGNNSLPNLPGAFIAGGHDRYSTSGFLSESQPFLEDGISLSHNGNLTNINHLREKYGLPEEIDGAKSDSRMALAIINRQEGTEKEKILAALKEFEGAYSFVMVTRDALYAARDPLGFKPLSLGELNKGGYTVASETAAFYHMDAKFVRDVLPGEVIRIDDKGVTTVGLDQRSQLARCIFELIYIARIDSKVFGIDVAEFRLREGEILSRYMPEIDVVTSIPRSGIGAAQGVGVELARIRGIPYLETLYTNPYTGVVHGARTFIRPSNRIEAARAKYTPIESNIRGKRIGVVDDSVIRGSVAEPIGMMRGAGAKEIHLGVAAPPIKFASFYGVDMGNDGDDEFIANRIPDLEERRKNIGVDSMHYLTWRETVEAAVGNPIEIEDETVFERHGFCGGCFTGRYPTKVDGAISKR